MGLLWLQVITCLACIFQGFHATESSKKSNSEFSQDALLMSSLFGFRPCIDEDCSDLPHKSAAYDVHKHQLLENLPGSEYAPEYPQIPSPDPVVEYCLPLHTSTLRDISLIEKHHPDVNDVKQKVIEDLVRYVAHLSILDAENCDPAMKLLDFILLASEAVRQDYITEYGAECNYTKIACGEYAKSSDHTEAPTTTSKSVDCTESVSQDYDSTSASYEIPIAKNVDPNETNWEDYNQDYAHPPLVGSVRGIPGVHYPNYTDVPVTSFSCADKKYIPGFYADLETGCQVFHVCYEHRRESFLCPVGTIFNQPILACDYWYSSNCSLATAYYEINYKAEEVAEEEEEMNVAVEDLISVLVEGKNEGSTPETVTEQSSEPQVDITKFLPVKAKVTEFTKPVPAVSGVVSIESPGTVEVDEVASLIFNKMVSSATNVVSQSRGVIGKVSDHGLLSGMKGKVVSAGVAAKVAVPVVTKAKLAAAATLPVAKIAAAKVAVPAVTKAKLAAAAATVPVAKIAAAKVAVPAVTKAKLAAAAATVPVAKIAAAKVAVPVAAAVSVPASKVVAKAKLATVAVAASAPAVKIAAKVAVPVAVKTKLAAVPLKAAAASIPGMKVAAAKTVVPVAVKSKLAGVSVKAAVPAVGKAKFVAAVPKVAIKSSVPLFKTKIAAVPLTKSKMVAYKAASAPLVKAKVALPIVKSTFAGSVPIVKAKLGTVAAISPLTKKALALGYMKLLKAKKLALVG